MRSGPRTVRVSNMEPLSVYGTLALKLDNFATNVINAQLVQLIAMIPEEERESHDLSFLNERVEVSQLRENV